MPRMEPDGRVVRALVIEDHEETRHELVTALTSIDAKLEVVGAYPTAEAMLAAWDGITADVAFVDISLPGMSGTELIRTLSNSTPSPHCIALTVLKDAATVLDTLRAGAYGYMVKGEHPESLARAAREAARGEHPISPRVAGFLLADLKPEPMVLSPRERELANALADGSSYAKCAEQMGIKIGTVQDYVKTLYRKLGVNSKTEVQTWLKRHCR